MSIVPNVWNAQRTHLRAVQRFAPFFRAIATFGVVLVLFSLQRVLFFLMNADTFPRPPFMAFAGGVRFDMSATAWLFLPWTAAFMLTPNRPWARVLQRVLFLVSAIVCFFLNCVDLEYYKFTLKRSTSDLFGIASGGGDLSHLAPVFAVQYWYVLVIFIVSLFAAYKGYRWAERRWAMAEAKPWWLWRIALVAFTVLASRGGLQYMPLAVLDASAYAAPAYMPLVLNTPFTVMTSIGKPVIEARQLMPQEEAEKLWPVVHQYGDTVVTGVRPNVVVIVLESFSAAYSARLSGAADGYMPFLDSLMGQGLCCTRAYANGRRSVDGIPAVLASIPKLMEEAFTTSPYADARITGLAGILAEEGYATSFYHGGHNGTMGFDAFARSTGFQRYVGRDEYPHAEDDDGVWGVRDEPFLRFYADELDKERQPFMSALFTLSSHHPYKLSPADAKRFAGGNLPIHPTLRYTDNALRTFFSKARAMSWFAKTLFIITADHTADLERAGEQAGAAYDHWIPLLYYMPSRIAPRTEERTTEQIDILPTTMDLIGHDKPFFAFGTSVLRDEREPVAVSESNATWLVITPTLQLRTDLDRVLWQAGIGPYQKEVPLMHDTLPVSMAKRTLRAAVQQFERHMLQRDMRVRP